MNYRKLGKTGLEVSEISLGTWQVGGGWGGDFDKNMAHQIIEEALDAGVNFLDTADVYDNQQSEAVVGSFVKRNRDKLIIATKIGRRLDPHSAETYTPEALRKFVDEALINTGLEYLDLVQLHCPPTPVYNNDKIFEELEKIKASGKVRHFGVSVEKVEEAIQASEYEVVSTVQIIFNMFRQKPLERCLPLLKAREIGVIARVPLASGLLTGKMTPERSFHSEDHRNFNRNGEVFDKGETFSGVPLEIGLRAVDKLKASLSEHDLYKYALKWILIFDEVSTVIPGASKPSQVRANINATDLPELSASEIEAVRQTYDEYIREYVHDKW